MSSLFFTSHWLRFDHFYIINKKCLIRTIFITLLKKMNLLSNEHFSEKGKNNQIISRRDSIERDGIADILSSFKISPPKRLQELYDDEQAFIKKYIQARVTLPVNSLDDYKILVNDGEITLVAIIKNLAYMCKISDEKDQWDFVDIVNSPYKRMNYIFRFSLFQKVGKNTFVSAVRFKYPSFTALAMEEISIIDTAQKTITPLPVEIEKWTYLVDFNNESIRRRNGKIIVECGLTHDLQKYVSEFDSRHDAAESRTVYGPHYYADCEIDRKTKSMKEMDPKK